MDARRFFLSFVFFFLSRSTVSCELAIVHNQREKKVYCKSKNKYSTHTAASDRKRRLFFFYCCCCRCCCCCCCCSLAHINSRRSANRRHSSFFLCLFFFGSNEVRGRGVGTLYSKKAPLTVANTPKREAPGADWSILHTHTYKHTHTHTHTHRLGGV